MTRSLISAFCGLVAAVALTLGSTAADAGHRRNHCCQQSGYATAQCGGHYGHRHSGCCGWQQNRYVGYQQTACCTQSITYAAPAAQAAPVACAAPVATTCCTPQPVCCVDASATAAPVTPTGFSAPQPPVAEVPIPAPGN